MKGGEGGISLPGEEGGRVGGSGGECPCNCFAATKFQILGTTHPWGKLCQNPSGPIHISRSQVLGSGNQVALEEKNCPSFVIGSQGSAQRLLKY